MVGRLLLIELSKRFKVNSSIYFSIYFRAVGEDGSVLGYKTAAFSHSMFSEFLVERVLPKQNTEVMWSTSYVSDVFRRVACISFMVELNLVL